MTSTTTRILKNKFVRINAKAPRRRSLRRNVLLLRAIRAVLIVPLVPLHENLQTVVQRRLRLVPELPARARDVRVRERHVPGFRHRDVLANRFFPQVLLQHPDKLGDRHRGLIPEVIHPKLRLRAVRFLPRRLRRLQRRDYAGDDVADEREISRELLGPAGVVLALKNFDRLL